MRLAELGERTAAGLVGPEVESIALGLTGAVPRFLEAGAAPVPGPLELAGSAAMFGAFPSEGAIIRNSRLSALSQDFQFKDNCTQRSIAS